MHAVKIKTLAIVLLGVLPLAGQRALGDLPPEYSITDLGTLGGDDSYASRINEDGKIVGWARTPAGFLHAFLWDHGTITDLTPLCSRNSRAWNINDSG